MVAGATVCAAVALTAAGALRDGSRGEAMTDSRGGDWLGEWRKVAEEGCREAYPETIVFREGGVYEAPGAAEAGMRLQSGDYEVSGEEGGSLLLQAANDAMLRYRIVEKREAAFVLDDGDGCRVGYRRSG